jgi:hypothetical protein
MLFKTTLIPLQDIESPSGKPSKRNMDWYKHNYMSIWQQVVRELEKQHPTLALCARGWKAEEILRSVIQNNLNSEQRKSRKATAGIEGLRGDVPILPNYPTPDSQMLSNANTPGPSNRTGTPPRLASKRARKESSAEKPKSKSEQVDIPPGIKT